MKYYLLTICAWAAFQGQLRYYPTNKPIEMPVNVQPEYNPYQLPNYYQNNSSFVNNSMQTNAPANPHSGPYTGRADYTDPSRDMLYFNSGPNNTVPVQAPPNNPINVSPVNNGVDRR